MRKLIYTLLILLIAVIIITAFWSKSSDSKLIAPTLNSFYKDFVEKDYINMYKYTDFSAHTKDPNLTNEGKASLAEGLLNNDRHWYGNIQSYSIDSISWRGINKRSATVAITTLDVNGDEQTLYDEIIIKRKGSNWFITEYNSGSPWRTMKMP
ncbi:hypothetical protein LOZ80_05680 [Paenibacillus sp. HWE-109]|uniref:hypothetical protein n=1 Tax=Paenibacillus sp. HWE-109 TaxID=1306526 RepID=UPI001EDE3CAC|nr:hypothetical protein [Paenibacillus sp. HWE-109]UKS28426.1 hypothetical protein LOZ80_05680 [Paenibacillus sp. HWE-109]